MFARLGNDLHESASHMPARHARSTLARIGRTALCIAAATTAGGCATWKATDQTPYQVFAAGHPSTVRVTTSDGERTVLRRPRILGEVIAGFEDGCMSEFRNDTRACDEMGFPVFDISVFEVRERGLGAILLPAAGGLLAVWLVANR